MSDSADPPGQVLAAGRRPLHHVGEADAVVLRQTLVMHVIELLVGQTRQEETFPWTEENESRV